MSSPLALIIEDDFDLSTIFAEALKAAGFEIEIIRDGQKASERLDAVAPDVVVLDLHLPSASGAELLEQIKADEKLSRTRVLVTTADAGMADMLREKVDLTLVKPISFSQLRDLAKRLRPPDTVH